MGSVWNELDSPLRLSVLLGLTGGVTLLSWTWPWFLAFLSVPSFRGESGADLSFFVIVALTLPFLSIPLLVGSYLLLFKPMSQERRGVFGFLLFILGGVPTFTWFYIYSAGLYVYFFRRYPGS